MIEYGYGAHPDKELSARNPAKALLKELGYAFSEVKLDHSDRSRIVGAISGRGTVPPVFINGTHVKKAA